MKDRQHIADEIVRRIAGLDHPHVVEVGVEAGKLSATILAKHRGALLWMIDTWAPMERQPYGYVATGDPSARKDQAQAVASRASAERVVSLYPDRAFIVQADSVTAAGRFKNRIFDLVFLDADHSEAGVRADIEAWLPKIAPGGWIGGHDYENPETTFDVTGVKRAVDAAFGHAVEFGAGSTWWQRVPG